MPNHLASATSPYLLQHADNPVDWWPWTGEAFAEAERRGVPVLLSVGYAACHWCHVMAHESFEDVDLATQLNRDFVAIKVDREERPDVDAVYMQATTAMTGHGGWPMTVFLTPDRRPFYAGTYFPPTSRHGLPGFVDVLGAVAAAWRDRRDEVVQSAGAIADQLSAATLRSAPATLTAQDCATAVAALARDFDHGSGGFGAAPKFPPSMVLEALLREGSADALQMVDGTLRAMALGGINDQLGGGFARYSVDAGWVVPHFEKMLYDNALLLGVYTHWWRRTADPLAERVVTETIGWLEREMRTADGAYAASLDADSDDATGEHREGAYYVWTPAEMAAVLGDVDGTRAADLFKVTQSGTFEEGASTLRRDPGSDADEVEQWRGRLFAARQSRSRPARDDKVVAAWNGWLIDALVVAAQVFDRPEWLGLAVTAGEHVWATHWVDGRLRRTSRDGRVGEAPGILEDYGAVAQAAVRLAAATADPGWLARAQLLLAVIEEQFADGEGGYFDTAGDAEALFTRPQDPTDNATPSGLSATLHALALAAELTGEQAYAAAAERAAERVGGLAIRVPRFAGWLLADAISRLPDHRPVQIAVVGPDSAERAELVRTAVRSAPAGSVVVAGEPDQPGFALLADRPLRDGRPTAYVCQHFVCGLPVTTAADLAAHLA